MKATHILHLRWASLQAQHWLATRGSPPLLNPAYSSFFTSSAMAWFRSEVKILLRCFIGLWLGSTFRLWSITEGSIPGISSWHHANISLLCQRNAANISFIVWGRCEPTHIFYPRSPISNSSRFSIGSPNCDCYFPSSLVFSLRFVFSEGLFKIVL